MSKEEKFEKFRQELTEMTHIKSALAVLGWDQEVSMPKKGADLRAQTISNLAGILHEKFTSHEFEKLLLEIAKYSEDGKLDEEEQCIFREVKREFDREKKMPVEFVKELSQICSKGQNVWAEARKKSDFAIFLPYLKKIVELKRQEAQLVGFANNPYDALLDTFEPYMTTEEIAIILEDLKKFLVPFLKRIMESDVRIDQNILKGNYPERKQLKFNTLVAKELGFDFDAGRLDVSTHPFTTTFNPLDVRITTRFKKEDLLYSLMSTIHEAGHALYEQGIQAKHFGMPLGESISLGIHESQSRIWENMVGRGKYFWRHFYPIMQKNFGEPFTSVNFDDFHRVVNHVQPSFIRTEADEVTYGLHIILRFEIEKELIDGSIEVEDLPKIWNAKFKEYFGLDVPDDAHGVLQDVHWSCGLIGYFPTYVLGNLYGAQFYEIARRDIENMEEKFSRGEFGQFREWLKKNIHVHGRMYSADKLVMNVTGEKLTSRYFIEYIERKYGELYNLSR